MARKNTSTETTFPVAYSNVNFGDKTVSMGFSISRGNITPAQADKLFCGMRLTVKATASSIKAKSGSNGTADTMFKGSDLDIVAVVDINSYRVTAKTIGSSLKFAIESIDRKTLSMFSKREGQLIISKVQKADDAADTETADAKAEE